MIKYLMTLGNIGYHLILELKFRKGGSAMNFTVVIDCKFAVALGVATVGVILAVKMDAAGAKEVLIHVVDAYKEYAATLEGGR